MYYCGRGEDDLNGLVDPWVDRTYCNPPFAELKRWLHTIQHWAKAPDKRIAALAPARTHRKWYREAIGGITIVELNPLKFQGYDQAFPVPLHLLCFNFTPSQAWDSHGTVRNYPKPLYGAQ